jgi:hypothetical protein
MDDVFGTHRQVLPQAQPAAGREVNSQQSDIGTRKRKAPFGAFPSPPSVKMLPVTPRASSPDGIASIRIHPGRGSIHRILLDHHGGRSHYDWPPNNNRFTDHRRFNHARSHRNGRRNGPILALVCVDLALISWTCTVWSDRKTVRHYGRGSHHQCCNAQHRTAHDIHSSNAPPDGW